MPSIVAADCDPVPALQQNCLGSNSGEKKFRNLFKPQNIKDYFPEADL
jgi:hypothetical protein